MKGTKRCGRAERYCVSSRAWLFCVTSPGSSNQVRKCKSNRLGVGQISHIRSSQLLAFVPVGSAASLEATKSTSKTLKRAGPISAVSLPLIWLPNSESSLNESCLYSDSYGRVGSEFPALPIFRSRDENPCWLFNRLRSPESQALQINSAQMAGFLSGDFGREIATFCVISGEIRRYPAKSGDCRIILKRTSVGIVGIQLQ